MKVDRDLNMVIRRGRSLEPGKKERNYDALVVVVLSIILVSFLAVSVRGLCVGIVKMHNYMEGVKR